MKMCSEEKYSFEKATLGYIKNKSSIITLCEKNRLFPKLLFVHILVVDVEQ